MTAQLQLASGRGFIGLPPRVAQMTDEPPEENKFGDGTEAFIISAEENALAELLSRLYQADFARILFMLSAEAKDELRAIVGTLQAEASFRRDPSGS